jgi:putative FmdB family regulatory protein
MFKEGAMPTYDFECKDCGKEFTQTMSIAQKEKKKAECPHCEGKKVTQLMSGFMAVTSRKS